MNADIVFIIDHSYSMNDEILAVKNNISTFVNDLSKRQVLTRLGLISYVDEHDTVYFDFNNSKFTTDTNEFIKALDSIRISGSTEKPTIPLTRITTEYDWSTNDKTKRFAVLITDEGAYVNDPSIPQMDTTIQALKQAGISVTVIGNSSYTDYKDLVQKTGGHWLDIENDFSNLLSDDISNWVVENVYEGLLLKIVTEDYTFLVKTKVVPKHKKTPSTTVNQSLQ